MRHTPLVCTLLVLAAPAHAAPNVATRNVAIVIYDGVELLDFSGPGEVFGAAGRGRAFNAYTVAQRATPVHSVASVIITPAYTIENAPRPDIIVIPGGNADNAMTEEMVTWIQRAAKDAEIVMSVCNGAFVLAKAGLLDGLEATTHHGSIEGLREFAPKTVVHADRRYVDNGKVITAAGVSAGIDASLHVVTRLLGEKVAAETARYMEYTMNPELSASAPKRD